MYAAAAVGLMAAGAAAVAVSEERPSRELLFRHRLGSEGDEGDEGNEGLDNFVRPVLGGSSRGSPTSPLTFYHSFMCPPRLAQEEALRGI